MQHYNGDKLDGDMKELEEVHPTEVEAWAQGSEYAMKLPVGAVSIRVKVK